ncbi:Os10g0435600 [Oryza sativa Japonica Group]|uniref:Os10g0435600 protein n=1 Tax=Oryza sativa subsp. japonica TaxID=39947 RepID=A0A0N7KRU4_ORYSJ|nr:Os10g0435600 [Oryza sativa Japonica Group]
MNRIGIGAGASLPVDGRGRGKGRAPRPSSVRFPLKREFAGETTLRIARARVPPLAIEARRVRVTASDPPIEDPLEGVRELFAEVDDPNTTAPPGGNGSDKPEDAAPVEDVVDKTLGARAGAGRHILSDEDAVNFVFEQDRRRGWIHSSSSVKLSGGVMGCSLQHAHVPALEASQATPPSAMATEVLLLGDARAGEEAVDDDEGLVEEPQAAENVGAAAPAAP